MCLKNFIIQNTISALKAIKVGEWSTDLWVILGENLGACPDATGFLIIDFQEYVTQQKVQFHQFLVLRRKKVHQATRLEFQKTLFRVCQKISTDAVE